jgi:hypothetical protein
MEPRIEIIASEPSWVIESDTVRIALTLKGGHMAPVTFFRKSDAPIQPYYVSPWQGEGTAVRPPVLGPLRGDFFCMPFGGDSVVKGVMHTTHGEPATTTWQAGGLESSAGLTQLTLTMSDSTLKGRISKRVSLVTGQNVVYIRHVLEGFDLRAPLGHHATLASGEQPDALLLSTSPLQFGQVTPRPPHTFASDGEYNALLAGASFRSLDKVPTVWKEMPFDSCATFPRRRGFCDVIQLYNKPTGGPAWVTAVNQSQGWLWFALKDPAVLPSTLFWMENHGRHADPWRGRNCCLGLEDVCGYFAMGLAASTKRNELNEKGIPTALKLSPLRPTAINYIQGVTRIPKGFGRVRTARFHEGMVSFVGESGKTAAAEVDHAFVFSGAIGARKTSSR